MTRDEHSSRRAEGQRVADALTELFDLVAPSDRMAAEEELRQAGIDPVHVARRAEQIAARIAPAEATRPAAATVPAARRVGGRAEGRRQRGASADRRPADLRSTSSPERRRLLRSAAALVIGIAVGWVLARDAFLPGSVPAERIGGPTPKTQRYVPPHSQRLPSQSGQERNADAVASGPVQGPTSAPTPRAEELEEQVPPQAAVAEPAAEPDESASTAGEPGDSEQQGASGVAGDGKSWILDSNNWQQGEGMLPPVVLERVKKGDYWYTVVPVDPVEFKQNYSTKFWEASESNAGKYDLDPTTCGLKDVKTGKMPDFYFGYPFPNIDPKEPLAACKMAWNFEAANAMGEGQGATFTLNGIDSSGEFKRIKLWLHTQSFLGRHGGPIENPENLRGTALSNVLEPQDIDGVGGLTKRENNWEAQDKTWFYVPATRRVRRVNAATRSDPVAGLDIFADDLNCYGGKIEYYKWKLVGEQNILAPVLSPQPFAQKETSSPSRSEVRIPYAKAAYEIPGTQAVPWLIVDNLVLVPRPVWVLEGESSDPYYNFGKVIMYMDKDMYRIYWKLVHNRAGEYFYNAMCASHWSKSEDGAFSAASQNLVVGVNDKTNRACLAGRAPSQFIEREYPADYFSLRTLTHSSD